MTAQPEGGFTLIEALVALALGAVVVAAVLVSVRTGLTTAQRFAATDAEDAALSALSDLLSGDVQHAIGIPVTADGALLAGEGQSLRFVMMARPQAEDSEGAPVLVTYRIAPGAVSEVLRSETALAGGPTTSARVWQSASDLRFVFLDARDRWQDRWSAPGRFPRAIGIGLGTAPRPQIAAAFLPVLPLACAAGGATLATCDAEVAP